MICSTCGTRLATGASFCGSCGAAAPVPQAAPPTAPAGEVRAPAVSFIMGAFSGVCFAFAQLYIISPDLVDTDNGYRNFYIMHWVLNGFGLLLAGIALITAIPALKARFDSLVATLAIVGAFLAAAGACAFAAYVYVIPGTSSVWEFTAFIPSIAGFLLLATAGFLAASSRKR